MTGYNAGPLVKFDKTPPGLKKQDKDNRQLEDLRDDILTMVIALDKVKTKEFKKTLLQPLAKTIQEMSDLSQAIILQKLSSNLLAIQLFLTLSKLPPARRGRFYIG